jgi:hypothetical protein
MSGITLAPTSGLNLTLEGSVGFFQIARRSGASSQESIEVAFLETHVGFDPSHAANAEMLKQLTPFREIFDYKQLEFDEIMQRDIDDARVSTELIPYLLDAAANNTVKFFPPIVAVVLPMVDGAWKPSRLYPAVTRAKDVPLTARPDLAGNRIRSGSVGSEAFEFEYPVVEGRSHLHDIARLRLNTNKVRLVIIDGQHRAMALLALYRNLRDDWSDLRRSPFKDYYSEWTRESIGEFQLDRIHLPVVICAFPDLADGYEGDFDVVKAARSTFLTLNKTARKVSASRNKLLDDRDLMSHFLRSTLSHIKSRDRNAEDWLRIWNVELDQYRDRVKIESPVACTGVAHIYYMIEHSMFAENGDLDGVKPRSGKFGNRGHLESSLFRRLEAEELLGADIAAKLKRNTYTSESADRLAIQFHERYGKFILSVFDQFLPLRYHNEATLSLYQQLDNESVPQVRSILYEGQNIGRSFEEYFAHVKQRCVDMSDAGRRVPPELDASLQHLKTTSERVSEARKILRRKRADLLADRLSDKPKLKLGGNSYQPLFYHATDLFYDNVYCSVAFQAALVCGFFNVVESAEDRARENGRTVDRDTEFKTYLRSLNDVFAPTTLSRLRSLIRAFHFGVEGDSPAEWTKVPTNARFHGVVTQQEMKPDDWPKYQYILLEIWASENADIEVVRKDLRDHCRKQVFRRLHDYLESQFCEREKVVRASLNASQRSDVFKNTFDVFDEFLKALGLSTKDKRVDQATAREWMADPMSAMDAEPEPISE